MEATVTLPTEDYGPVGFALAVSATGEVTNVVPATAALPEAVFRLTYGDRWEDARAYILALAENLVFRAEVAIWLSGPPAEFKLLRRAFRKTYPDAPPPAVADTADYRRRAAFWLANPAAQPVLFVQKKVLRALTTLGKTIPAAKTNAALVPWLYSLLPLYQNVGIRRAIYALMAQTKLPEMADYILSELERSGRHPYASGLLGGCHFLDPKVYGERMLGLYAWIGEERELMSSYLHLLGKLGKDGWEQIIQILDDHPSEAAVVKTALLEAGHPAPSVPLRERFEREYNLLLIDQLAELTARSTDPDVRVSLEDMNARMDDPAFLKAAPVTWPQSLWSYWASLLDAASDPEVLDIVGRYLPRPEPFLQRNALLQLRRWAKRRPFAPALPPDVEERLRELVPSRIDKISTVAVDILGLAMPSLADPAAATDVLLKHTLVSRYRLMDFAALKKAAELLGLRERQVAFFRERIAAASPAELANLKRIIPYLTYLGAKEELRGLLRRAEMGSG